MPVPVLMFIQPPTASLKNDVCRMEKRNLSVVYRTRQLMLKAFRWRIHPPMCGCAKTIEKISRSDGIFVYLLCTEVQLNMKD